MHQSFPTYLPTHPRQYFQQANEFLMLYRWIYDFQVTKIFDAKPWNYFLATWCTYFDSLNFDQLSLLPVHYAEDQCCPLSLKDFFDTCTRLQMPTFCPSNFTPISLPNVQQFGGGMTLKKQHEVGMLATVVHQYCSKHGVRKIVDVGCGLGYISRILVDTYGYAVLGVDCQAQHCKTATCRSKALTPLLRFIALRIDGSDTCRDVLIENLELQPHEQIAMIGLHLCGDLQVDMFKLFDALSCAAVCITIGCCYHKMSTISNDTDTVRNFGLSQYCRGVSLSRFALRLAAQQAPVVWSNQNSDDHQRHQNYVVYRALLDSSLTNSEDDEVLRHQCRKVMRRLDLANFESFLRSLSEQFNVNGWGRVTELQQKLREQYEEYRPHFRYIEPTTCLQTALQPVLESLIVLDRCLFMEEWGHKVECFRVFDPAISPRNCAIIVQRHAK